MRDLNPIPSGTKLFNIGAHVFVDPAFRGGDHYALLAMDVSGVWHCIEHQWTPLDPDLVLRMTAEKRFLIA